MVRMAGERWKEALISGNIVDAEQRYIEAGFEHDWIFHVARERNQETDTLARKRGDGCEICSRFPWSQFLQVVYGRSGPEQGGWTRLARASYRLSDSPRPVEAEKVHGQGVVEAAAVVTSGGCEMVPAGFVNKPPDRKKKAAGCGARGSWSDEAEDAMREVAVGKEKFEFFLQCQVRYSWAYTCC